MRKSAAHRWLELGQLNAEILLASSEVIPKRLTRLASANTPVSARDQREFARMSQEKLDAGAAVLAQSAMALATAGPRWTMRTAMHWQALGLAGLAIAGSTTGTKLRAGQAAMKRAIVSSTKACVEGSGQIASSSKKTLKPVHHRAVANAKRLRKS